MSTSTLQVTVTEELLSGALPKMRESVRLAAQKRYTDHLNKGRWIMVALGILLLPLSALLILGAFIHIIAPRDVPLSQGVSYGLAGVFGFALGIPLILIFAKRRDYSLPWIDGSRLQNWSLNRSARRLLEKVPFEVDYTFGKQQIEARIDDMEIRRRTPLDRVQFVYVGDHFFAMYTGSYIQPLRWIYFETEEQRKKVETHLQGVGLSIVSLEPIVDAEVVH